MPDRIHLSRACLGTEEKQALCQVIEDGYLGMGQQVMFFERELENFLSNKVRVACVNTGTSALQLALQACGVGANDEVLIPSITYVASFQAASATGAKPIACDIDIETGCIDINKAIKKITPRTKAIMPVHYAGSVGDRESVFRLAKEYSLRVIEDAAHSFGGYYKGDRIGSDGDIICFSFDGIKNITCGEGGAIASSDEKIVEKIQDLRMLGVKKDSEKRYTNRRSWDFEVEDQGWRYHMSNLNAALGRVQLKKIDNFGKKKRDLVNLYMNELTNLGINFLKLDLERGIPHIFPVLIKNSKRNGLQEYLNRQNIETGIHYKPNHLLKKYNSDNCEVSEDFWKEILSLPLHVSLSLSEIIRVCKHIQKYLK